MRATRALVQVAVLAWSNGGVRAHVARRPWRGQVRLTQLRKEKDVHKRTHAHVTPTSTATSPLPRAHDERRRSRRPPSDPFVAFRAVRTLFAAALCGTDVPLPSWPTRAGRSCSWMLVLPSVAPCPVHVRVAHASFASHVSRWTVHSNTILPPSSSSFFFNASASSLIMPALITVGVFSTSSLASFNPNSVTARTSLMILILLAASKDSKRTSKAAFSSLASSGLASPDPGLAMAGIPAIAGPPNPIMGGASSSLSFFFNSSARSDASSNDRPAISSASCATRGDGPS
mmetsp:Transcript_7720/g.47865  ORF Transcript_7720/g.47865 Transcript_7720/m.47865 type:complete len:288 (-) Transcript_7720:501-1364(-)